MSMGALAWVVLVVPAIAVATVIGTGFVTVQVVKKLEEWKDGTHAALHARIDRERQRLATARGIDEAIVKCRLNTHAAFVCISVLHRHKAE